MEARIALHEKANAQRDSAQRVLPPAVSLTEAPKPSRLLRVPPQIQGQPIIPSLGAVVEQEWAVAHGGDDDIHPAIVVVIRHRAASGPHLGFEIVPAFLAGVTEGSVPAVFEEEALPADQVMGVAVGDENIQIAVVIEVEKTAAPADELCGKRANPEDIMRSSKTPLAVSIDTTHNRGE